MPRVARVLVAGQTEDEALANVRDAIRDASLYRIQRKYDRRMLVNAKCAPHYIKTVLENAAQAEAASASVDGAQDKPFVRAQGTSRRRVLSPIRNLMAEDPLCIHTPGRFAGSPQLTVHSRASVSGAQGAPAIEYGTESPTTIAWHDAAAARMKKIPAFVRGTGPSRSPAARAASTA